VVRFVSNCCSAPEQASGVEVASFWPKLFVGAMANEDMNKLICSLPAKAGGGDAAPAAAGAAPAAAAGGGKINYLYFAYPLFCFGCVLSFSYCAQENNRPKLACHNDIAAHILTSWSTLKAIFRVVKIIVLPLPMPVWIQFWYARVSCVHRCIILFIFGPKRDQ